MTITEELTAIADQLGAAIADAKKFESGNNSAGTMVRNACQEARGRLFGLRTMVTEVRKEREAK